MRRRAGLLLSLTLVSACAPPGSSGSSSTPPERTVTVLAAASLADVLPGLGRVFEAAHPRVHVVFSYGASSTLARQAIAGAPADLLLTASASTMQQVTDAGDALTPRAFASNVAEVAVYPARAAAVRSLADLARPGVRVALCQPQVPCGALAAKVLVQAHVTVRPVTQGLDVKSTLAAVTSGEADAAIVYATDVRAAGTAVVGVPVPDAVNASTAYEVAVLRQARQAELARSLADLLLAPTGQSALLAAGFRSP